MKKHHDEIEPNQRKANLTLMGKIGSMLNLRMLFGVALIALSFISAFLISSSANRMVTVWSAKVDLAAGSVIDPEDVETTQVLMPSNIGLYLDGNISIVGNHIVRAIGASEIIPAYALSEDALANLRKVPISVPASKLPYRLKTGELVDVYGIPKQQLSAMGDSKPLKPGLILNQVAIEGIDLEASKLGGEVGITLLVPEELVARLIQALAISDFVLVKSP